MKKTKISSGTAWENSFSYARVVRAGNLIEVSGTVAADDNGIVGRGDIGRQCQFILEKIEHYLQKVGADRNNVIRTRIYVTDISKWEAVGKVHGAFFKGITPASSMVEVSGLVDPDFLVEIEATAIVENVENI